MTSSKNDEIKIFYAGNGKKVAKFVTDSGVTGYVDCDIPLEVLEGLRRKLEVKIKRLDSQIGPSDDSEDIA